MLFRDCSSAPIVALQRSDGGITSGQKETVGYLMDCLSPGDPRGVDDPDHVDIRNEWGADGPGQLDAPFEHADVKAALLRNRWGKASGVDGLRAEFLLSFADALTDCLTSLFNLCVCKGVFPECWKPGVVRIFLKSPDKDPSDPKTYRPITLLSVLGKTFERCISTRIEAFLGDRRALAEEQNGFVAGRGTVDALHRFKSAVFQSRLKYVATLCIDIFGAFDGA